MRPGAMITAGIGGVIAIIIALVTYPILQSAADTLYLEYVNHCKIGSESFTRIYAPDADGVVNFSLGSLEVSQTTNATTCQHPAITATSFTGTLADGATSFYSEHGELVATLTIATDAVATGVITGGVWTEPYEVLQQYSGISTLVLSILPILSVTGFLGMSAANLYKYTRGDAASIQGIVTQTIGTLLVVIIGLYLAPTIFQFLQDAFAVSEGNRYTIMGRFNTIIVLVFSFVPVIFCAGLLVMFGQQGMTAYKTFSGGTVETRM